MKFSETPVVGAWTIDLDLNHDERGFFARSYDRDEFVRRGMNPHIAQCSVSFNARRGLIRGMHYQVAPYEEAKLVRCTAGALFDVVVDLREGSPTRLRWHGETLSAANRRMLYIPEGCAHGFMVLEDATEVSYQISRKYSPEHSRELAWDDPEVGIDWPLISA